MNVRHIFMCLTFTMKETLMRLCNTCSRNRGYFPTGLDYAYIIFGRYCSASAKCAAWILSHPARSAIAR
jgi:hypothetical protein